MEPILQAMTEYKNQNRRATIVDIVSAIAHAGTAEEVKAAAIEWHKETFHCGKVPADTIRNIELALGLAEMPKSSQSCNEMDW